MVKSRRTKITDLVIAVICFIIIMICLLPMLNMLARSFSDYQAIINRQVAFWPVDFTLDSYKYVFKDPAFSRSMIWTGVLTVICTCVSMTMTVLCAYPLTYDKLKGRNFINTMIILTMFFSAGTIPNYILMDRLNLIDNPLVLIFPNCLSVFYISIYLPMSTSVLATLALFYAVGRWNGFADALIYVTNPKWAPIQLKLYQVVNNLSSIEIAQQEGIASSVPSASEGMKAAAVMFATLPILMVYPRLQKYFISGVTIGAVKG
jgi:putative aldouronate transport system permease protein